MYKFGRPAKVPENFDYDKCFDVYLERILNVRRATIHGEKSAAKPALLCAVLLYSLRDGLRMGEIYLDYKLRYYYFWVLEQVKGPGKSKIESPFCSLQNDGFWHLHWFRGKKKTTRSPSAKLLDDNLRCATLDRDLWILIANEKYCAKLYLYIIAVMFPDWAKVYFPEIEEGIKANRKNKS